MHSHDFALVENIWMILLVTELSATITQGPSNTVAEIGKQVKLNCTANAAIGYWFLSTNGVFADEVVITGPGCSALNPEFAEHYTVESLGGGTTCNLIVFNVTMGQAGVYRCIEGITQVLSIITVTDSSPVITVNSTTVVENESVLIDCVLNHNGSMPPAPTLRPYFYWTNSNGQNVSSYYDSTTENTAVSQITVIAGLQDIMPYTCHVFLQLMPPTTPNYANNIPAVSNSASSPIIEVIASQTSATTSMVSESVAPIATTNDASSCNPVSTTACTCTSNDSCSAAIPAAIAVGVILFISVVINIIQLIFLIRNLRDKHDPYKRTGTILQPEILDLSNGTSAPAAYEELRRPTELDLLPITYEKLTPKPPIYANHLS